MRISYWSSDVCSSDLNVLMIGHCGGLRPSQRIGDYVLAHAYLRDEHILDSVLPPEIPIPPIAEMQQALASAAEAVSGTSGAALKKRMRTGTEIGRASCRERWGKYV